MCTEKEEIVSDSPANEVGKKNERDKTKKRKKGWSQFHITIEPIKLCLGFTIALSSGVTIDLLQRNICYQNYGLSLEQCISQNVSKTIKAEVEAETAQMNMLNNIVQGIVPLILVLFIGPWSDTNGRKPFILCSLTGYLLYYLLWAVLSFFPFIPVLYFMIPSIPLSCTGAIATLYVCTWSYTCDSFEPEERTKRFSISVAAYLTGSLVGNALADEVVKLGGSIGFQLIFIISFVMILIALMYSVFILEETIVCQKENRSSLFNIKHVKSILDTVIIHPEKGRWLTAFVLTVLFTEVPTYQGDEGIVYLVGKSNYNWELGQYNLYSALGSLLSGIVPVFEIWLAMEVIGLSNCTVLILSTSVLLVLQILRALSVNEIMFWVTGLLMKTVNLIGPTIDTELANTVNESNVGKAFTFTSIMDSFSPLIAVPLYTQIYKYLLPDNTLHTYFISVGLTIITVAGSICLHIRKQSLENKMNKEINSDGNGSSTKTTEETA